LKKYKKLISKGFFQNFILEILKKLRNYGRHGNGKILKFLKGKKEFFWDKKPHGSHGSHGRRNFKKGIK
jgi:hypothetical protein